jgi:hypothetical protein
LDQPAQNVKGISVDKKDTKIVGKPAQPAPAKAENPIAEPTPPAPTKTEEKATSGWGDTGGYDGSGWGDDDDFYWSFGYPSFLDKACGCWDALEIHKHFRRGSCPLVINEEGKYTHIYSIPANLMACQPSAHFHKQPLLRPGIWAG